MYVTPKIFGVELDNLRQLLAYFIGIWRKTSAYQIRTFQYGSVVEQDGGTVLVKNAGKFTQLARDARELHI